MSFREIKIRLEEWRHHVNRNKSLQPFSKNAHSQTLQYVSLGGSFCFWVTLPCLGDTHFTLSLDAWCPIKSYSEAVSKMLLGGKNICQMTEGEKKPSCFIPQRTSEQAGRMHLVAVFVKTHKHSNVICTDMHTFVAILLSSLRGSRCNAKLCVTVL